ncbi:glycosyltransferase family 4 protein [Laspinema palackyanum]|uniref:glycosyltransferase family 4 protein n=1 Tax=Laspinema palackyanum TaxID=3231601 RepID=UPI00345CE1A1|nr:glycosyltransferase family 4 protein [Laspinema sp. D2c]
MPESSLKLLYTITAYPPAIGGAQLHTHKIVSTLAQTNQVRVITHWTENRTDWLLGTTLKAPEKVKEYEIDGVDVKQITLTPAERKSLIPYIAGYYGIKKTAIAKISKVLLPKLEQYAEKPEIIHNVRMGREGLSYASWQLAQKLNIPFVFVPLHHPRWVGWLYREYINLYRQADAVIALTQVEKQTLIELGVKEENIFVTGIGPLLASDGDGDRFRNKYSIGSHPILLFLGQKYEYKGIEAFIKSAESVWKKFPETRFVAIGPQTKFSEKFFAEVNDHRILELDKVSLEEKTDALAACDLLCVPSMQESFGGVYTEAWMMKKPVIGGNIPAIRDVIDEGINGFLVEQNPSQIADKIIELLNNPSLCTEMGEAGCQKVLEHYTWEKLAEKTKSVYTQVLHRSSGN